MCVKFSPRDLNADSYPLHLINIYICEVTTTPRGSSGYNLFPLLITCPRVKEDPMASSPWCRLMGPLKNHSVLDQALDLDSMDENPV